MTSQALCADESAIRRNEYIYNSCPLDVPLLDWPGYVLPVRCSGLHLLRCEEHNPPLRIAQKFAAVLAGRLEVRLPNGQSANC